MAKISKSKSRRGAELLEFTFALLPLLMMVFVLMDAAWGIFVKSTLAYAVRTGVRVGITITGTQARAAGSDLTTMVKSVVQRNALGLLGSLPTDTRLTYVKVNYFLPPLPGSSAAIVNVSSQSDGNAQLNIMQVSIQGFSLNPLLPRIFGWKSGVDNASTAIGAIAADLIEPSRDTPLKGNAP
jgi:Flp pilus assembly protein TadG